MLDAPDVEHAIVIERAKRHTVIAAAGHQPAFKFNSQRLG